MVIIVKFNCNLEKMELFSVWLSVGFSEFKKERIEWIESSWTISYVFMSDVLIKNIWQISSFSACQLNRITNKFPAQDYIVENKDYQESMWRCSFWTDDFKQPSIFCLIKVEIFEL